MKFHPVIRLPSPAPVLDFSKGFLPEEKIPEFAIGKYNEKRPGVYTSELYQGIRDIHIGIDLFAPVGTPIHAFADGKIFQFANHKAHLDYGHTLITEHDLGHGLILFALHGHLDQKSLAGKHEGQVIRAGEVIAWVGDRQENGGWIPHLHFQLSYIKPTLADMPGVVSDEDHAMALLQYPDPRLVLGTIY